MIFYAEFNMQFKTCPTFLNTMDCTKSTKLLALCNDFFEIMKQHPNTFLKFNSTTLRLC